jgi:hypothetical protein
MDATKKINSSPLENAATIAKPLGIYTVETVHTLSYTRIIAGVGCILAPTFTSKLFRLAIAPNSFESVLVRFFGIGPTILGDLTWFSRPKINKPQTESERHELRHLLWAGVATDTLEGAIAIYGASMGFFPKPAAICLGGVSTVFAAMGLFALREV